MELYRATLKGDWNMARQIISADVDIVCRDIAYGRYTVLHVAAGKQHVDFVKKLLEMITPRPDLLTRVLRLRDERGNTAFCLAAAAGSVKILKIMIRKDPSLQDILGPEGKTPLYIAAMFGHEELASYLYSPMPPQGEDLRGVFFTCINTGLYGLAFRILRRYPNYALERHGEYRKTALHVLAEKSSAFNFKTPGLWTMIDRRMALYILRNCPELSTEFIGELKTVLQLLAHRYPPVGFPPNPIKLCNKIKKSLALRALKKYPELVLDRDGINLRESFRILDTDLPISANHRTSVSPAQALVEVLWSNTFNNGSGVFNELITWPTHLLFDAVKSGNAKLLAILIRSYHPLISERDSQNRTLIHAAVASRQASICKLIQEIAMIQNIIVTLKDDKKNTMLHLAAQLAPQTQLQKRSGAAFQMQQELKWFEDVKKIMLPADIEMKNSDNKTPQEIFTSEHATLLKDAEKWMNDTARSCMVVSGLLVSALFTTGITVTLGVKNNYAAHHLKTFPYYFFIFTDAVALFLDLIATIIFFYILTSRYAERDFLQDLPSKLIRGLIFLFLSIIAMMMSFTTVFFIAYGHKNWLPYGVGGCAIVAVFVCLVLLIPVGREICASTSSKSLFEE